MQYPAPSAGSRSASGVRRGGDEYQDLVVWSSALQIIRPGAMYGSLEVERNGNGNFDDVVLRAVTGRDLMRQVKWSTNETSPFDEEYLTKRRANGTSLLEKMYGSHITLTDSTSVFEITSNRHADPRHPVLGSIDGRSNFLLPDILTAAPSTAPGRSLAGWAAHVSGDLDQLLGLLRRLRLLLGRSYPHECERAALLMEGAGLRSDQQGLDLGMAVAREWVTSGRRVVLPDDVRRAIHERGLQIDPQRAVLLVQALDRDAHPEDADEQLDWVDLFAGDSPMSRRAPVDHGDWQRMQQELQAAVGRLEAAGHRALLLRGTMRQATFFLVGTSAPRTRDWSLRYSQRRMNSTAATPWDTAAARTSVEPPHEVVHDLRAGDDLVVAVCATTDGSREIIRYVRDASIPARRVLVLTPPGDAHDESLPSSGHAVSFAQQIVKGTREHLRDVPVDGLIHLFLIGPGGFAMILGNRWNALRRTIVYEHLGVGLGYEPAFDIH